MIRRKPPKSTHVSFRSLYSAWRVRPALETLEARLVLASDFGDAPLFSTLLAANGAEHVAVGPTLGATRDSESNGVHSANADGDDAAGIDDEDGVTFGPMRVGALGATATVNVQGGAAKLDAWIDFNRDGSWGDAWEQIAESVSVATGNNTIAFDIPAWARDGTTYARFRLSTSGNLGLGGGPAHARTVFAAEVDALFQARAETGFDWDGLIRLNDNGATVT